MTGDADLDRLIYAHLDGDLDEAGASELGRRISADPAVARRVLSQAFVAEELPDALAALHSATARLRRQPQQRVITPARMALAAGLLVSVCALSVMGLMWGQTSGGAKIVAVDGTARIAGDPAGFSVAVGTWIPAGARLLLDDGARVEVQLGDGSRLTLSEGAETGLGTHASEVHLVRGRCVAEIAPQHGARFRLFTPSGEVSVIGTRFQVAVSTRSTEVVVDHGRVAVARAGQQIELGAGQWTLAGADRELRVHESGDADLERSLLGWWPCDEANHEDIRDHSPWGRHGRIVAQSEGVWSDGGDGASAVALGDHGLRPDGVRLPILALGSLPGLTVALRLRWESGASPALLGEGPARFLIDADGHPLVEHRGVRLVAERALPANTWHQVAWRWSRDGRWDIFVDGQAVAGRQDGAWNAVEWPAWPLALGHPTEPRVGDFALVLNQVRLYGRALSDAEVATLAGR